LIRRYVYYRVAAADAAVTVEAVRAAQRRLFPGARAELLRRPEVDREGLVTLMEVYHVETEDALAERELDAASAPWRRGERHVEDFVDAG
jgi:hypothetical protein